MQGHYKSNAAPGNITQHILTGLSFQHLTCMEVIPHTGRSFHQDSNTYVGVKTSLSPIPLECSRQLCTCTLFVHRHSNPAQGWVLLFDMCRACRRCCMDAGIAPHSTALTFSLSGWVLGIREWEAVEQWFDYTLHLTRPDCMSKNRGGVESTVCISISPLVFFADPCALFCTVVLFSPTIRDTETL